MFDRVSAGADAIHTSPRRLKKAFFTVKNFKEQKFQDQKNGEKGHFSDPAANTQIFPVNTKELAPLAALARSNNFHTPPVFSLALGG